MKKLTDIVRTDAGKNYLVTFVLVTSLFLLWGFCNGLIDVLNKHFQNILNVSKAQSGLVQTSVFGAYLIMAFPVPRRARERSISS